MQIKKIHKYFDKLQLIYGDKRLDAIYGAGCIKNPDVCFVFMNPTGKNVSAQKEWEGLKAPWIGTKNVWKLFSRIGIFDQKLYNQIADKRADDWDYAFAQAVYDEVAKNKIYITNLSKATQLDARHLKDSDFMEYVDFLKKEIEQIRPKVVIAFGNQVSSVLLNESIQVSQSRKRSFDLQVNMGIYKVFPVFYPVGQGMRNINKSIEDIRSVLSSNK